MLGKRRKKSAQEAIMRRAVADDAATIAELSGRAYLRFKTRIGYDPLPMTQDYAAVLEADEVWLLEAGTRALGVLVLRDERDYLLVYSVAIEPDHQGQGFGRRLMALAENRAREIGRPTIQLYTNQLMTENIAFYQTLGYQATQQAPHPKREGSTLVYMEKRL